MEKTGQVGGLILLDMPTPMVLTDRTRSIWRYRDWVINALNQDKPFDEFTIEQLAGDLLPNPSVDHLLLQLFIEIQ